MTSAGDKALHGAELGIKGAYLLLGGAILYVLWKILGPKAKREVRIPPPVPGTISSNPEPEHTPPPGTSIGGLVTGVRAAIIVPPDGGQVNRHLFGSTFPATLQIVNDTDQDYQVAVTVEAMYDDGFGSLTGPVVTTLGPFNTYAQRVVFEDVDIDTGESFLQFQLADLMGVFSVKTNEVLTQGTSFRVS